MSIRSSTCRSRASRAESNVAWCLSFAMQLLSRGLRQRMVARWSRRVSDFLLVMYVDQIDRIGLR